GRRGVRHRSSPRVLRCLGDAGPRAPGLPQPPPHRRAGRPRQRGRGRAPRSPRMTGMSETLLVHGSLMMGYAQACRNLKIVVGRDANRTIDGLEINRWYPLAEWRALEQLVVRHYADVGPILVRVGMEMMKGWYHMGPGRELIERGRDFLHFQTDRGGRGPPGGWGRWGGCGSTPRRVGPWCARARRLIARWSVACSSGACSRRATSTTWT